MRIAIMNWRDIRHPRAGGAEIATYEVAQRWIAQGHQVVWFAAAYEGCLEQETFNGIEIVRRGAQYSVHWHAWRYYRRELRGSVDVVIDQVNTIPFFTPLYVQEPRIVWAHQLAREVWWYESAFPLNLLGFLAEPVYWQVYRKTAALAGSMSTGADLRRLGLTRITCVAYGTNMVPVIESPPPKNEPPTILYIGRVVPSKRVAHVVRAVAIARQFVPDIQLVIAGRGDSRYIRQIKRLIRQLDLDDHVTFTGYVNEEEKRHLLAQAHLIALASVREGWGLVVIEANTLGTPAIAYDVPGVRDSVQHNQTGIICQKNTPVVMGHEIAGLLNDKTRLEALSAAAREFSRQFTWDRTADEMMQGIIHIL